MIVIGDVHGCHKTLMALVNKLPNGKELCFLGDLIDRGEDSKKVVSFVKDGGHRCVLGNHEDMALLAQTDPYANDTWMFNGGGQAVKSYGGQISEEHLDWFITLPYFIEHDGFVMSHSNIAPGLKMHDAKTYTIWNRDFDVFLDDGRVNVFGHTPVEAPVIKDTHIMLDTGCVFGRVLTAFCTETRTFYWQENIETNN